MDDAEARDTLISEVQQPAFVITSKPGDSNSEYFGTPHTPAGYVEITQKFIEFFRDQNHLLIDRYGKRISNIKIELRAGVPYAEIEFEPWRGRKRMLRPETVEDLEKLVEHNSKK